MKQMKKNIIIILLLISALLLSGCSKKEDNQKDSSVGEWKDEEDNQKDFSVGKWKDNVYKNNWLNMKFEIDDDWSIATDDEISELIGVGAEYMSELKGTNKKSLEAAAKLKTIYAFIVYSSNATDSVQLLFENMAKTLGGTKYDEKDYLDVIKEQLPQEQYELINESTIDIAGKKFYTAEFSVNNILIQKYLTYKLDKYMVSFIVTYVQDDEKEINDFLNSITTIED